MDEWPRAVDVPSIRSLVWRNDPTPALHNRYSSHSRLALGRASAPSRRAAPRAAQARPRSGGSSEDIKGQTITVLVPYRMPKNLLDQFTAETGVKVNYVVTGWDATHNKLLVANEAQSYIADVAEFDWSFTGQFGGRLGGAAGGPGRPERWTTSGPQGVSSRAARLYAACYSNDFRVSMFNKAMFAEGRARRVPGDLRRAVGRRHQAQGAGRAVLRCRSRWAPPRAASRPGTC